MRYVVLLLSFFVLLTELSSCKKKCFDKSNKDCENYDPCFGKKETSAQFVIEEYLFDWEGKEIWVEADTFNGSKSSSKIRFRALNDADSFIWVIGAERFHTKTVIRSSFPSNLRDKVSLIVINKQPNKRCFPLDDGRDTSIHMIYTWPEEKYWDVNLKRNIFIHPNPVKGIYKGYYKSNPKLEVVVAFYDSNIYCPAIDPFNQPNAYLHNIPNGYGKFNDCDRAYQGEMGGLPFACIIFGDVTPINIMPQVERMRIRGYAILGKDRKSLHMEFNWDNFSKPYLNGKDEFNGIKIK
jgi:hypothetical protein